MKDSNYFSHDFGARNDPKLIELQMEMGGQGLAIFWCIVEMLWEMERSEANREELTRAAEELLDRANKFVRDFQEVGSALESARGRFEAAKGLLIDAPGGQSIAKAAGKLVKLGVKPHKRGGKSYELVDAIREES